MGVIIGGPWQNGERYYRKMKTLGEKLCGNRLLFTGFREDITAIYRELDMAVHPSLSENLGGAAESLSAGVPTIATNVGGFPDIVNDKKTGLLAAPKDPDSIIENVEYLLGHKAEAKQMARKGKVLVKEKLDGGKCADKVYEMYQTLLGSELSYQPRVTIIIPVYNGGAYLKQAIDGALGQTYKNLEIIVVNDGSNDNGHTRETALSYGGQIIYLEKENGGVSSALNTGIARMSGQWFSWLSHDDGYAPGKIENQIRLLNVLLQNRDEIDLDKTVLYGDAEIINSSGKHVCELRAYQGKDNRELILKNIRHNRFNGCSFLLPYACFHKIGLFNETLRTVSDYEYWFRLLFHGYRFYHVGGCDVQNRLHPKQVTHTKAALAEDEMVQFHLWMTDEFFKRRLYQSSDDFMMLRGNMLRRCLHAGAQRAQEYAKALGKKPGFFSGKYHTAVFHLRSLFFKAFYKLFFFINQ
ncbi:MAG: hypothetical protein BGN88_02725 [Clostridiales bacterium 43-6]|nr:MAG: hypothetical protein BGN88_02725 [Clostridiales bacterium 43-6]